MYNPFATMTLLLLADSTLPDVKVFLSNKLCQGPIENVWPTKTMRDSDMHDNLNRGNCRGSDSSNF